MAFREGRPNTRGAADWRLRALRIFFFLFACIIGARLFALQVVSAHFYNALAEGQYSLYEELVPDRGQVVVRDFNDATLYPVATNESRGFVYADPRKIDDPVGVGKLVAKVLGIDGVDDYERADLIAGLESQGRFEEANALIAQKNAACLAEQAVAQHIAGEEGAEPVPVDGTTCTSTAPNPTTELIARLAKHTDPYEPVLRGVLPEKLDALMALKLPGIAYILESARFYPEAHFGGQLLGFVGRKDDGTTIGEYGVEGYWNSFLAGTAGSLYSETDGAGRWIGVGKRAFTPAQDGGNLVLTVDRTVQFTACGMLRDAVTSFSAKSGTLVIVEPSTGRVLAMCNAPDFDPNDYGNVDDAGVYNNDAVYAAYEPGSIMKPLVMAGALDLGAVTANTAFDDPGFVKVDDYTIHNAADKVFGHADMTQVLEESINTGMVFVMRRMGRDNLESYLKKFGFGMLTGVEVNSEAPGDISHLDDSAEVYAATAAFGQGITTTPLQIVMAYAAIANGGTLMQPSIIDEVDYADGTVERRTPKTIRQVVSAQAAATAGAMLVAVVENGHGKRAAVSGYWVAGKTGTAQVASNGSYSDASYNGSFAGFAPATNAKFAMIVKIENPQGVMYAESTAAPLFGKIAKFLLQYYNVPPERSTR